MTIRVLQATKRPGFLLVEVMLGIVVFGIFLSGLGLTLIYGQENTINAGDRARGAYLTERSMEAVRAIRDGSFASVTAGTKGIAVSSSTGKWAFTGTHVTITGSYILSVTVSPNAADWVAFTGTTTWKHGYNRAGTIKLAGEITDWKGAKTIGNWAAPTLDGSVVPGGSPQFNSVVVAGNTAYVTCGASAGLYMFDITSTTAPSRLNAGFSIGYGATGVAVRGKRLYVMTADPGAELKVYNISSPSVPVLVTTYNLPGSALGTSLAIGYNKLYIGATYSATAGQYELYSFDISHSGSVVLKSSVDETDTVNAIAMTGTSAYLASSLDTAELRVAQAVSSGTLTAVGGFNLTDRTLNGTAIAVSGTSALLGTQKGASIQEVVMFDIGNSGGVPSGAGPWYHEGSGSVTGLSMDPYRCYTFIAASSGRKAFQVMDMRNKATLAELFSYNSVNGLARGLSYDLVRDRVYLLTDQAFLIFRPAASAGTCP